MEEIHQFYAVTKSGSLYLVSDEIDPKSHCPIVEKIDQTHVGHFGVGGRLRNGNLVGITHAGIVLFITDKHNHTAEYVNTAYWGGTTSPIIGLFMSEVKARECFNSNDLQVFDNRWINETNEVLGAIGSDHDIFRPELEFLAGL